MVRISMVDQVHKVQLRQYTLRAVTQEQHEVWDQFVSGHTQGHLLQSWGWGELKARSGWSPVRLALWDQAQNQIVAAVQVLRRTAPRLPLRAGHLAYVPKGPVLDWSQPELVEALFSHLNAYLSRQGALSLHIEFGQEVGSPEHDSVAPYLTSLHFHPARSIQPKRTILVDLTPDEETILARMKKDCRYSVRMAARKGVTVRPAETVEDVQAWYTLMETTSARKQFGIHTFDYYLNAWRIFSQEHQARLLLAEYQGQLLAGIFVAAFAKKGYYLYAGSGNEHRNLMPSYLLQWEGMRWAKQEGALEYDLWGIPETDREDEAMAGVYKFKAEWGGRVTRFLGAYAHTYRPLAMRLATRFITL